MFWKVVADRSSVDGRISSVISFFSVDYKVGEFVASPWVGTPLCVFDNLKDASNFAEKWHHQLYTCEIRGRFRKPWVPWSQGGNAVVLMNTICDLIRRKKKHVHLGYHKLPKGTVCVREVKLLERVF